MELVCDKLDTDDDDGVVDTLDAFPFDASSLLTTMVTARQLLTAMTTTMAGW